jgi:plasmid maintenance system antidote protein VapI|tara:strand:+ start:307 stop:501 length:195 start_codon:yes stop_codon:yes gene_type:complete
MQKVLNKLSEIERTPSWLARKIRVSPSLMTLMIQDKRGVTQDNKQKMALVLHASVNDLFEEELK